MATQRPWSSTLALLLALVSEGYDLQAANFAAPAIVKTLGISKADAGPLLSASLLGVLFGAVLIGPVGDRFGRKRLITDGCSAYGILSLLAALATTLPQLISLRFLIGLGLGGVLPNALALASELARPGREATAAGLIGIGITFGGVVAGLAAAALIPIARSAAGHEGSTAPVRAAAVSKVVDPRDKSIRDVGNQRESPSVRVRPRFNAGDSVS